RGWHLPTEPPVAGRAQGEDRGRRATRGPVAERMAGSQRGRRRRARAHAPEQPQQQAEVHRMGPVMTPTFMQRHGSGATMQTYETNQPIALSIELSHGAVHIIASDRTDTVVAVNPSDP